MSQHLVTWIMNTSISCVRRTNSIPKKILVLSTFGSFADPQGSSRHSVCGVRIISREET